MTEGVRVVSRAQAEEGRKKEEIGLKIEDIGKKEGKEI